MKDKDESYKDYRDRVINSKSPSFCAAKWLNSTIWLNNGTTASCHHPPAHNIIDTSKGETIEFLKKNPSMIHNTTHKKEMRSLMLEGKRPSECQYCWKIEDISNNEISDRVFKTVIYDETDIDKCVTEYKDVNNSPLKTLEIAFDANCNFACSYCNSNFSTTWQSDIHTKGSYINLISDGGSVYSQDGTWAKLYKKDEQNPYVESFWQWWPELSKTLGELRITGGEATMSPDFWKLIDWWKINGHDLDMQFAVNSNLGIKDSLLQKLIDSTHYFNKFSLYSSCETTGLQAEYIRDGLNWSDWKIAVERIITEGKIIDFNVMMTINSLCLFGITDFLDYCHELKQKHGRQYGVCSLNILRFPSFMSASTLPLSIRQERANHIENWLDKYNNDILMHDFEKDSIKRLINYLREINEPHDSSSSLRTRELDFKSFFLQYDERRNKDFTKTFPELKDWFNSL